MKRVIVCGGRDYSGQGTAFTILDDFVREDEGDEIAQGGASGADALARDWAEDRGCKCTTFKADWTKHGRAAGPIRNQEMLVTFKPDLVIAFPGGAGTADMVRRAKAAGIQVVRVEGHT